LDVKAHIRDIPDFPQPGILFRDITPLLQSPDAFADVIDRLAERYADQEIGAIVGIEARGFLFAAPLALRLGKPFVPVRKEGKLPFRTIKVNYSLEYGQSAVEVHTDAIDEGQRVLILDDLLATGGTLAATAKLIEKTGGVVAGVAVVIELSDLKGRDVLEGYDVLSLVTY
jgi:adenine phosphoribosyltransferase